MLMSEVLNIAYKLTYMQICKISIVISLICGPARNCELYCKKVVLVMFLTCKGQHNFSETSPPLHPASELYNRMKILSKVERIPGPALITIQMLL